MNKPEVFPDPTLATAQLDAIKSRMKATWEDGDYARFATYMEPGAVRILEQWEIPPGVHLLDIGCGAGQTAIPAAHRGIRVTGIDIAANLIECARRRAQEAALDARFDEGDAEALPYADASFDVAISLIGAMFAPRPALVAAELARVVRPGGKLYMANWTARGMPGQMFKCVAGYMPPPAGVESPVLWGDEATVQRRLEQDFTDIRLIRKHYPEWHYDLDTWGLVDLFCAQFGPVKRTHEALDEERRQSFREALELVYRNNSVTEGGRLTITGGEYLEVIATRK